MSQIVIIDDSRLAALVVRQYLNTLQIKCEHLRKEEELFGPTNKLDQLNPDVILLDIMMPDMDGLDVLSRLKQNESTKETPVVMLSSSSNAHNVTEAVKRGAFGFIAKPIDPERLGAELLKAAQKYKLTLLASALEVAKNSKEDEREDLIVGCIDLNYMMNILDNDEDMLRNMVVSFLESAPKQVEDIEEAIKKGDPVSLKKTAHLLKGTVANFSSSDANETTKEMEALGDQGDIDLAREKFPFLSKAIENVNDSLMEWLSRDY